jgi:hypothetical protein
MVKDKDFTLEEVLAKLEEYTATFPTRNAAAEHFGVNRVFLWRVLEGKQTPTEAMLEKIGIKRERQITYTFTNIGKKK